MGKSEATRLHVFKLAYLGLIVALFSLLLSARSGEVYTVWHCMHPLFIPLYFVSTLLLLTVIFWSDNVEQRLLFVMIHSVLSHSFFIIMFPAGDLGGQQLVLGRTRLTFDNVIMDGWPPWPVTNIFERIYHAFRGLNFQTAYSVTFARLFGVDVFWTHLSLIPVLWGIFVPLAAFMTAKALGTNERIAVLAGFLVSLFPSTISWGTYSVPNSLGFIFFACAVPLFLKYLTSNDKKTLALMLVFSFISFMGHALTGITSASLVLLVWAIKKYEIEKHKGLRTARIFLFVTFIFSTCLMPFALVYLKFFYPINTNFSLTKIFELSASEFVLLLVFGQTIEFELTTALLYVAAPLAGLLSMVYILYSVSKRWSKRTYRVGVIFLFLGILMFLVQHRILNLFMSNIPFPGGRLWMFRDFMAVPLVAIFVHATIGFLHRKSSASLQQLKSFLKTLSTPIDVRRLKTFSSAAILLILYLAAFLLIAGWITASVYRAYPHFGPLQTTSYELRAALHIDQTEERYIVVCDQWFIYAAEMMVGVNNPDAYYFTASDPEGVSLFLKMRRDPTPETLVTAMQKTNASVAYFVIEERRIGESQYELIKSQALQNGLSPYPAGVFYYQGREKLSIFYYRQS
ncbi:MAG: hypothetical protein JSV58_04695 [Candidatus Bathyarchaeota archaeon]|nr:MAG: hypothetical protein JSV58_04695 [Candidatus Bathyarchaeota archaeon]